MAEHQDIWPMTVLCAVLEVSRSGFYTYRHRQKTRVIDVTERALVARGQGDCGRHACQLWQSPHG